MTPAQTMLEKIARQACQFICCDAALLVIDCPAPELRHPLLALFPATTPPAARMFGASRLASLLRSGEARAAYDIACQRGEIQYCELTVEGERECTQSLAVAPLAGPAGILGYVLLANASGFTRGDDALLLSFVKENLYNVESAVRTLLLASLLRAERLLVKNAGTDGGQHQLPEMLNSISMVSHELRSPLAAIKGYAGLLQAYSGAGPQQDSLPEEDAPFSLTPAQQQRYLDMILEESQRLEELIADLLDASRMQSGKLTLSFGAVDVGEACERAARRARRRIEQVRHARPRLECQVTPHLPPMYADAKRLQHILDNLLDNAIKYSPQGGTIELLAGIFPQQYESAQRSSHDRNKMNAQTITIVVRDQGIGIPADQRARLFQPFSRIDNPQVPRIQGVGLGLYITRQLIEAMHGTIDISGQVDRGTVVTLCFPAAEQSYLNDIASTYVLPSVMSHSLTLSHEINSRMRFYC
ncbi:MAG TPA: HAMP domain-containing sensor histidine kinase [Ktedonobacteraceae bacterium]|nr:HAMP domain-containing sensor histidine kinase [Ktedonobacteraceae bacterium]